MDGKSILNFNLKDRRLDCESQVMLKDSIARKYQDACARRERAQNIVEKYEMQLKEQRRVVQRHEELLKEEEVSRRKLHALLRKHDNLNMEEYTDFNVQVWLGDWVEDMPVQDTWQEAYSHAKWLVEQL